MQLEMLIGIYKFILYNLASKNLEVCVPKSEFFPWICVCECECVCVNNIKIMDVTKQLKIFTCIFACDEVKKGCYPEQPNAVSH